MAVNTRNSIVTNGLVLYLDAANRRSYPGTGTVWSDLSGNNNSGTLTNGPTFSNQNGGSIVFDGNNDYVEISNTLLTSRNISQGTIEMLVRSNVGSTNLSLIGWGASSDFNNNRGAIVIGNSTSGIPNEMFSYYNFNTSGTNFLFAATGSTNEYILRDGRYHSIVIVNISGGYKAYLDGVEQGIAFNIGNNNTVNTFMNVNNVDTIRLGWESFNSGRFYMNGDIAITRIYNRALSQAEITQNYNATKARFNLL